jgi:hypothetical protein
MNKYGIVWLSSKHFALRKRALASLICRAGEHICKMTCYQQVQSPASKPWLLELLDLPLHNDFKRSCPDEESRCRPLILSISTEKRDTNFAQTDELYEIV